MPPLEPQRVGLILSSFQGVELEGSKLLLQLKHPVHATPPHTKVHASSQQTLRG